MSILVLVVAESIDESRDRITSELIAMAQELNPEWIQVAAPGADSEERAKLFASMSGVTNVYVYRHDFDSVGLSTGDICQQVENSRPTVVLMPATLWGRDLAPRVAARLDVPIAADVISVKVNESGSLACRRQVQGGRKESEVTLSSPCAVITTRPGSFRGSPASGGSAEVIATVVDPIIDLKVTLLEEIAAEKPTEGIATASRIVSGGRGLGKPENFALVEELAAVLNAAVGASGAVVGAGWRPHSQQIGSTGTTVAPRLYLAVGISGAVQHTIGMSGSDAIVAINRDPDAPIFQIASLGVVGDLFEIVPALIEELKKAP